MCFVFMQQPFLFRCTNNHEQIYRTFRVTSIMKYITRTLIVAAVSLNLSVVGAMSQVTGDEPNVLTMEQCLDLAEAKNIDVRTAESRLSAASARVTSAFGQFLPGVTLNSQYTRTLSPPSAVQVDGQYIPISAPELDNYSISARADLTVFDGFRRESSYNKAQHNLEATKLDIDRVRQATRLQVRQQYLSVMQYQQIQSTREEDLELSQKELERIQARLEVGKGRIGDVYQQEAEIGTKELALIRSENDVAISKSNLLTTIGLSPVETKYLSTEGIPTTIDDDEIASFRRETGSLKNAIERAHKNRTEMQMAYTNLEATESDVTAAKSTYLPSVNASGGWSWSNTSLEGFDQLSRSYIGVGVSYALFDRFRTSEAVEIAQVEQTRQKLELERLRQRIESEVQNAFLNLSAAEKELDITTRSLKSAQQNFDAASERYALGGATILDYTVANTQLVSARINRINAVYNYLRRQYEVLYAIGELE